MPMANSAGGGEPNVAMSGQDADAQQSGGETAAASSGQGTGTSGGSDSSNQMASGDQMASASGGGYDDAVKRAEAALASGDEAACLAAVQEARGMQGSSASQ